MVTWCHRVKRKVDDAIAERAGHIKAWHECKNIEESRQPCPIPLSKEEAREKVLAGEREALSYAADLRELILEVTVKTVDRWYMITWAPPREGLGFNIGQLNLIQGFVLKNSAQEWEFALEQKGESEDRLGYGAHVHYLIRTDNAPSSVLRDTMRHFGKTGQVKVGDDRGKFIRDKVGLERARNYIRGMKHNEAKELACAMDKIWRARNHWLELYQSSTGVVQLSCMTPQAALTFA